MFHFDFCPYLELKALLADPTPLARKRFELLFIGYYGLDLAGLSQAFLQRYFQILFDGNVLSNGEPRFAPILSELYLIPRRQGGLALQLSFVSKLVAIHSEISPIYDQHVQTFFSEYDPGTSVGQPGRVAWFVDFLKRVSDSYAAWAQDERLTPILQRFKARDEKLALCHVNRLLDFLVWKVGNQKLL
ncbi:MAG TPA: hypothetical protein VFA99_14600 [Acidobacteriaceae bacterium]|nr:hypothetical protein [Acidobacteriaceae bacterium]